GRVAVELEARAGATFAAGAALAVLAVGNPAIAEAAGHRASLVARELVHARRVEAGGQIAAAREDQVEGVALSGSKDSEDARAARIPGGLRLRLGGLPHVLDLAPVREPVGRAGGDGGTGQPGRRRVFAHADADARLQKLHVADVAGVADRAGRDEPEEADE